MDLRLETKSARESTNGSKFKDAFAAVLVFAILAAIMKSLKISHAKHVPESEVVALEKCFSRKVETAVDGVKSQTNIIFLTPDALKSRYLEMAKDKKSITSDLFKMKAKEKISLAKSSTLQAKMINLLKARNCEENAVFVIDKLLTIANSDSPDMSRRHGVRPFFFVIL